MSIVSDVAPRRKPGCGETASASGRPKPSYEVSRPRLSGRTFAYPEELEEQAPPPCVRKVFRYLDRRAKEFADVGTWDGFERIARETHQGESTVRTVAIPWLLAHRWIEREDCSYRGKPVKVTWCLWLFPDAWDGAQLPIPGGARYDVDTAGVVRPTARDRKPRPAAARAESAGPCAHGPAPESSNEFNSRQNGVNVSENAASPGGEGSPEAEPEVVTSPTVPVPATELVAAEPTPPPAPPARKPAAPKDCRAVLAGPFAKYPKLAAGALWDLIDQGEAIPDAWAGKVPPRPIEEAAPAPRPAPAPAKPATPRAESSTEPPTTLEMLRRICPGNVEEIASAIAERWEDFHSINCHRVRLAMVAEDPARLRAFAVSLYQECEAANLPKRAKAKLWNQRFSDKLAGKSPRRREATR